jgi:hypothetical protein
VQAKQKEAQLKKLIAAILALAVFAPAAAAATHFVKVSPTTVAAGLKVRVYGTVSGCPTRDQVIITSKAFKGATRHSFAHVPALFLKQNKQHKFSSNVTLKTTIMAGNYTVSGRCGGGNFAHTKLTVTPGYY